MRATIHYVLTIALHHVILTTLALIFAALLIGGPVTLSTGIALSWLMCPFAILYAEHRPSVACSRLTSSAW